MSVVYLVLVHDQPEHAARLVERLSHPDDVVLVHVDKKADLAAFEAAFAARGVRPTILRRRVFVVWGGWHLVRAMKAGMDAALALERPWSHLVVLSGADYPIRSTAETQAFFAANTGRSFLSWSEGGQPVTTDAERHGNAEWYWSGDTSRLLGWKVDVRGRRWHLPNDTIRWMPRRRIPRGLTAAQGTCWTNLSREGVAEARRILRRRPLLQLWFWFAFAPDENVFQMILLASRLRPTLVNEDLRYMHWEGNHPPTLVLEDVEEMLASKKLFARKFKQPESAEALDELDRRAGASPRGAA